MGLANRTVRFWDVVDPRLAMPPLNGHTGAVRAVAFSPDGTILVSGSDDKSIRVWDVEAAQQRRAIQTPSSVSFILYSPDGKSIVAGDFSGNILRCDDKGDKAKTVLKCGSEVKSLTFAPDGSSILAAHSNDITSVDLKTKKGNEVVTGLTARVNATAYSPDGKFIASGGDDATVCLWDAKTGKSSGPGFRGHSGAVLAVAFSADGRSVVSAGMDGMGRIWNITPSRDKHRETSILATARMDKDGWLITPNPTNHRLLWVPPTYRNRITPRGLGQFIAGHWLYDLLHSESREWYHGEQWAKGWCTGN